MLRFSRIRPPIRRVLALDSGSRSIKLLLAESDFGRLRITKEELIDLHAEGLVSADEIRTHLQAQLEDLARPPLALGLPQHVSTSQVLDLPMVSEGEVEKLIETETIKLSGVSESRIVYDFVRIESASPNRQQFWVTLCREPDIRERILRLGVEQEDLCEVTTTANALIAAYRANWPLSSRAVLVHMGAQTTVVVVLVAGQAAFATSFQMGGDFFTRALARLRQWPEEKAESVKRGTDLLNGPDAMADFVEVVNGWVAELKRQLDDWFDRNPGVVPARASFELVASGGGFDQPGLLEHLHRKAALSLRPWSRNRQPEAIFPSKGFEVAFGIAVQALGYSAQPVSLLPQDYRNAWRKRQNRQRLEWASTVLLALCTLALAFGTWHKLSLIDRKQTLLAKVLAGQETAEATDALTGEMVAEYEALRPVFAGQQNTVDTLKTLALLQHSRSNRSLWYVLLADQQSYFSPSPPLLSTNKTAKTNSPAGAGPTAIISSSWASSTNVSPAKPGLIAELCVPEDPEAARRVVSHVVKGLKEQHLFSKVDLLSDDLHRSLADPKVVLGDRHWFLALDFAQADFQQALRPRKTGPGSARNPPRRSGRPGWSSSEEGEKGTGIP